MKPTKQCPLCHKKWYTRQQVIDCMELDAKEEKAKRRRLIPIGEYQQLQANTK